MNMQKKDYYLDGLRSALDMCELVLMNRQAFLLIGWRTRARRTVNECVSYADSAMVRRYTAKRKWRM